MSVTTVTLRSDAETLTADLYGALPASRAVVLVHGRDWDASGWRDVAPAFAERSVPALALNLRGRGGSTGSTDDYQAGRTWSPVTDVVAAIAFLREAGVREIALVGSSLGGHAVLAASFGGGVECVVSISAPVNETPDAVVQRVTGRKLFLCADADRLGAAPHVRRAFDAARAPKSLLLVDGAEHSRELLAGPHASELRAALVEFVCRRG